MIALSTTDGVLAAMQHARAVTLTAYVLRPGRVLRALQDAAYRGARVTVRLEARPYGDTSGELLRENSTAIGALRAAGADAATVDGDGAHPLHLKAALIDRALYLDDRNWPDDGADTIIRDCDPRDLHSVDEALGGNPRNDAPLATQKDAALRREANVIYRAADAGEPVDVQSESFGYGRVCGALRSAAQAHVPIRLLVAKRDVNAHTESALKRLIALGVSVRVSKSDEKMALAGDRGWLGSANATMGIENQLDWGLDIFDTSIISSLRERFNATWDQSVPYP